MSSLAYFLLIGVLGLVVYIWLDSARARELATAICRAACSRSDYQFLDDTVSLLRVAPCKTPAGIRLRRVFTFDFSVSGAGRLSGTIVMLSTSLEALDFGLNDFESAGTATTDSTPPQEPPLQ